MQQSQEENSSRGPGTPENSREASLHSGVIQDAPAQERIPAQEFNAMTELSLTENQRGMARHALGFDGRNKTSYRNHFVVGKGRDHNDWMDLVSRGLARHRGPREISGGDDTFWCTRKLALAVREKNEHLEAGFRE